MIGSIRILENKSSEYNDIIPLSAHRHIALTMISLQTGNSVIQLLAALFEGTITL